MLYIFVSQSLTAGAQVQFEGYPYEIYSGQSALSRFIYKDFSFPFHQTHILIPIIRDW
jgi:hypothetical protein